MKRICSAMLVAMFFVSSVLFFVEPASALYVAEDIGVDEYQYAYTVGINNLDQIVATASNSGDIYPDSLVYDPGAGNWTLLPDFGPDPYARVVAEAINNDGEVVGYGQESSSSTRWIGVYWPASYDSIIILEPLSPISGSSDCIAYSVNDLHEAVGYSVVPSLYQVVAVQWNLEMSGNATSIAPQALGSVSGMNYTFALDINNNHEVVGYAYDYGVYDHNQAFYCAGLGSIIEPLPHLSDEVGGSDSVACAISDSGLIVGYSRDSAGVKHAVAWQSPYNVTPVDLGADIGYPSEAYDVSTDQKIVGFIGLTGRSFIYDFSSGTHENLANPSGFYYSHAVAVNDCGHVTGWGPLLTDPNVIHAILWAPNAPPVAAFTASVSGLTVTVNASASYDHEGEIADYAWDFGDGEYGSGMIANHTYAADGPYTIVLTVMDSVGQTDSLSLIISAFETPKAELVELIALIEECTSFDEDVKDRLTTKVSNALDLIEARKSHGDGVANVLLAIDNMVSNYVLVGKIASEYEAWDIEAQINFVISLLAENHMVAGVPVYTWYHGCGPTATGMLMGYWDTMGFGDLVNGPQGNEMFQSAEVNAMIASESHVADYVYPLDGWLEVNGTLVWFDPQPDESESGGASDDDCLADFMHTSRSADGLVYGQSYADMVDDALVGYTDWASGGRYVGTASIFHQGSMSWGDLQVQVDAARPMVFVVDWNGDGESDHLVTIVGYCEIGNAQLYAFYSTWDDNVWWALFDIMKEGNFYGVFAATTFSVANAA